MLEAPRGRDTEWDRNVCACHDPPLAADDAALVSALHARVFGPGRFARTAYRVREGTPPIARFCRGAFLGERLIAALRLTEVTIGGEPGALLLGPLAIDPDFAGEGWGASSSRIGRPRASRRRSVDRARRRRTLLRASASSALLRGLSSCPVRSILPPPRRRAHAGSGGAVAASSPAAADERRARAPTAQIWNPRAMGSVPPATAYVPKLTRRCPREEIDDCRTGPGAAGGPCRARPGDQGEAPRPEIQQSHSSRPVHQQSRHERHVRNPVQRTRAAEGDRRQGQGFRQDDGERSPRGQRQAEVDRAIGAASAAADQFDAKHEEDGLQSASGASSTAPTSTRSSRTQEAVELFSNYAKEGKNAELKNFAQQTLPTLEQHLKQVRSLDGSSS